MLKVILWDVDGTLLDFKEAEKAAMRECFSVFGLGELSDERIAAYSEINHKYWRMLEEGQKTKPQILIERFEEFFAREGVSCDPEIFNQEYQVRLGDTVCFCDNSYELIQSLRGRVKQYAVTNGTFVAQRRKLEKSGLIRLFDDVFISDQIGAEKPSPAFFDHVFAAIGHYGPDEVVIVGDSLTSDMRGGNGADILCCWYNPDGAPIPGDLRIDYDIRDLNEIKNFLG